MPNPIEILIKHRLPYDVKSIINRYNKNTYASDIFINHPMNILDLQNAKLECKCADFDLLCDLANRTETLNEIIEAYKIAIRRCIELCDRQGINSKQRIKAILVELIKEEKK